MEYFYRMVRQQNYGNTAADPDLEIYHGGTNSIIKNSTGRLYIGANDITVSNRLLNETKATFNNNSSVDLHFNGTKKFETSEKGIQVGTGVTIETNGQATFSGITTFSGNIELTGALNTDAARIKLPDGMNGSPFTGNLELGNSRDFVMLHDGHHNYVKSTQTMYVFCGGNNLVTLQTGGSVLLNRDLDVDGHTNLDNVSIAGVSTFTGNIDANGDLDVDGHTNLDNVSVAGVSTFTGNSTFGGNLTIPKIHLSFW